MTAIRGNVDKGHWAEHFPETDMVQIESRSIYLIHDIGDLKIDPVASGFDAVVYGHSHKPKIGMVKVVLHLNPGCAGRRRLRLPVTLATLEMSSGPLKPVIHDLMTE